MSRSVAPRQLVLALGHAVSFAREDFLRGPSNSTALTLVERWPDWPDRIMLLTGPEGAGKSHLASIWAETAGARSLAARSIGEANLPAAFATGALVLEDLAEGRFDERALFHLINAAREERAFVLITARSPPAGWNIAVPDLASRLRVLPAVTLAAPDGGHTRVSLCLTTSSEAPLLGGSLDRFGVRRFATELAGHSPAALRDWCELGHGARSTPRLDVQLLGHEAARVGEALARERR